MRPLKRRVMSLKVNLMKRIVLILIALLALYSLARNNLGMLPGQVMWLTHPEIFYKVLIPLLMLFSAIMAIIKKEKINYFYLSFITVVFDAVNRLSEFVNNYYQYFAFEQPPIPNPSPDTFIVEVSYVPSYLMLAVEVIIIYFVIRFLFNSNRLRLQPAS